MPVGTPAPFAKKLSAAGTETEKLHVGLSNELVHLLSEQLYQSPLKAIEELVVNSYDADASECRVVVPTADRPLPFIVVFDNGIGMDKEGLRNLWHVGRSNKRDAEIEKRAHRKQIGKFGIGKLATYTVATRITYVTKSSDEILAVALDYTDFRPEASGVPEKPVVLSVRALSSDFLETDASFTDVLEATEVTSADLTAAMSWTFVILEDLKPKAEQLRRNGLKWVLSTAMPYGAAFQLYLNGVKVGSSKAAEEPVVRFSVQDLSEKRLDEVSREAGEKWEKKDGKLVSPSFPNGVAGQCLVTRQSLYGGKSVDLSRSHGFFVRVRGRLINTDDPLFGLKPLSYETFNRFRADIEADDLDIVITAPRERVEDALATSSFQHLLTELYYEARSRYEKWLRAQEAKEKQKPEHDRNFVNSRYVERPVADVIASAGADVFDDGADADNSWFYLRVDPDIDVSKLVASLYNPTRTRYTYERRRLGRTGRLVQFDPSTSTFSINDDHELVLAHNDAGSRMLLEDVVTAEALLEVYLREHGISPAVAGEILEERDVLLRSLAKDRAFSMAAIADALRASAEDERDLETNLVIAVRALGFIAKHIGGGDKPDGIARFHDYPSGEKRIILEAKSSEKVPSLGAIDFAGLREHMNYGDGAEGCLLVAPAYPGASRRENSQASRRAKGAGVSCWTVDQLARVVESAEARHLNARHVLDIVLSKFAPDDVANAVEALLARPRWVPRELYGAIIDALRSLENRMRDAPRDVNQIGTIVSGDPAFSDVLLADIESAVRDLAAASQGMVTVADKSIVLHGDYDELERRVAQLTGRAPNGRRGSTFRDAGGA